MGDSMQTITIKNKPTFIFNQDFQTIQIDVIFPFKRSEENLAYQNVLPTILNSCCKRYSSERDFSKQVQKLFILNAFCSCSSFIDYSYFTFHFMIPDLSELGDDLLKEQFAFFHEMIYRPKAYQHHFYQKEVEREKENLRVYLDKVKKDSNSYANVRVKEILDPYGRFSSSIHNHAEEIDLVTTKNLYEFYENTILNNQPLIYIFGNTNQDLYTSYCNRYLYRKKFLPKNVSFEVKNYLSYTSKMKEVVEESTFRNSIYISIYQVKDMKKEDEVYLEVVKRLLSSLSSRLLNKKLRDENDLVYSTSSIAYLNYGVLEVVASIHPDSILLVKEKIKEVFHELEDEDKIKDGLEKIKERNRIGLITLLDDKIGLFQDGITKDSHIEDTQEEFYQKIIQVTPHDITSFMKRLTCTLTYFLKEGEDE